MKEIWFVHDQQESPYLRRHYLETAGFRVRTFATGDACLHALHRKRPGLLMIDVLLEGLNGFDVCRAVRANFEALTLPVILCSHIYLEPVFADEASTAGAQSYVHLPVGPEDLIRVVQRVLDDNARQNRAA